MAEKFSSQGTVSITGNVPGGRFNSGLWSADKQQPTEFQESQRWQKALRPNSPSDIELPPSPALSSYTQQDEDMLSINLPGEFAADTGNSNGPGGRQPGSTAYPSPSPSDENIKDNQDTNPPHSDFYVGARGGNEKASEPNSAWTEKNERVSPMSRNFRLTIIMMHVTDCHPTF